MKRLEDAARYAKVALAILLIAYLLLVILRDKAVVDIISSDKNWSALGAAAICVTVTAMLTICRWHMMLRALGITPALSHTLTIGLYAYLIQAALGVVASDGVKSAEVISRWPTQKPAALLSVAVDRIVGLYSLMLLASTAALFCNDDLVVLARHPVGLAAKALLLAIQLCTALVTAAAAGWIIAGSSKRVDAMAAELSHYRLFRNAMRLLDCLRQGPVHFVKAVAISMSVHLLCVLTFYFASLGFSHSGPDLSSHFILVPLNMIANTLPVGGAELSMSLLYPIFAHASVPATQGVVIALILRAFQLIPATLGFLVAFAKAR